MLLDRFKDFIEEWTAFDPPIPQGRSHPSDLPAGMTSCVFCLLDISGSMKEEDYKPNRLGAGAAAISEFAEKRRTRYAKDYLSVICFESEAVILHPLFALENNTEFEHLKRSLARVEAGGGTRLDQAFKLVRDHANQIQRVRTTSFLPHIRTLVLTDGHSDGEPEPEAGRLKDLGVTIEIIGIGGSPVEVNESLLKRCASIENGKLLYRFIGDGDSEALVQHFGRIALS